MKPPWKWESAEQQAFEEFKLRLISPPILAYPNYLEPFILHVDACGDGLGAVLCQMQDERETVIAYASKGLSKSERNYPAHKLEFLALKWAVTDKFSDYLYGHAFAVMTNNNPLTYVLSSAKLDATGHRWLAALPTFNFAIRYRAGKTNKDADALSRLPKILQQPQDEHSETTLSTSAVRAICEVITQQPVFESLCLSMQEADDRMSVCDLGDLTQVDVRRAQRKDPYISKFFNYVTQKIRPKPDKIGQDPESLRFVREFDKLQIIRGALYRVTDKEGQKCRQIVMPKEHRQLVLRMLHDDMGHLGRDKTWHLVKDRCYWPRMMTDIDKHLKNCSRCLRRKAPTNIEAPLINIRTTQAMEMICVDYLTLETCKGGYQYVLVITDHYTRYAQAIPTKNMSAKTTADALFHNFIVHYGFPAKIHSDQGANFESQLIRELCKLTNITKSRKTPFHPQGNGMCEHFNRSLMDMLGTLELSKKKDWKTWRQ